MVDILVVRDANRARVISQSDKGFNWIVENMKINYKPNINIQVPVPVDVIDDLVKEFIAGGLEVEIK